MGRTRKYRDKPDAELASLLQQSDRTAFAEIYERYWALLFRHALKMTRSEEDAKDIVQDVFTMAWTKSIALNLSLNHSLKTFLYTAVQFRVLAKIQSNKKYVSYEDIPFKTLEPGELTTEQDVLASDLALLIERELKNLPKKMREVFVLSRVHECSYIEISEQLDISMNTVKKQVSNALRILRLRLHLFLSFLFLIDR